ncbi:hypothetical protein [Burkholderia cenocepacia]|uniref:hypothetical protein n=1 Tax=Burkholderia cenocepacia TaxID=95486 RepID=UPI00098220F1|nr:hypothetical protein [Burkholderia cenocepacia]AQQ36960.1 hypothetical protein A8E96_33930 [Burkholderia cenocepacia]MBR7953724.1 hypothetical protein [Burkholderia cenocepacia]MBR8076633.1 hypothetical protein [Burkholderia cenocepacia]ONW33114.1 hypothetical protein A8E95_12700 [Burkholderia cenocepacia]RQU92576.1 hypothetical protein DF040_13300 [Burkholderia cenocepacia]
MSTHFGLPRDEALALAFEWDFPDSGLWHTRFESDDLSNAYAIERHVSEMFDVLESAVEIADHAFERRARPVIEQAQAYLVDIAPLLRLEWQLGQEIAGLTRGGVGRAPHGPLARAEGTVREILRSKLWRITKSPRFLVRLASART